MDTNLNEIEPAGESSQRIAGEIESGQPAGGPGDIGRKSHEANREFEPQDAMGAGLNAFAEGLPRDACPYPDDGERAEQWRQGWDHQRLSSGE